MSGLSDYLPADMVQSINSMTASPNPSLGGMPAGLPAAAPSPSALPGADPALQARVAQSLQNPNAGDAFGSPAASALAAPGMAAANTAMPTEGLLPGSPADMAAGAVVGSAFGLGLKAISDKGGFEKLATAVDKLPGIRNVSSAIENRVSKVKGPGGREWLMRDAIQKGSPTAIANMEKRQLSMMAGGYAKMPEVQKLLGKHKTFASASAALQQKIVALESKSGKLSKQEYKQLKAYRGAFHSIKGINTISYKPLYTQQAAQMERLAAKGVGPVGRGVASLSLYTQRIFGGDTLKSMMGGGGEKAASAGIGKLAGNLLPAALGGAFIFGSAISKARKAEDGKKTSTFMHDFLGIGLGSFIGWEIGQKFLTAIGFRGMMDKVGNKIGIGNISNRLLTPGRGLLEKVFSPATISKITKFLPKLTFGGTAVGLIGMFVFGGIFQKIFEKVSDSIFGKPDENAIKPGGAAGQQAALAGMGGGLAANNAFAGFQQPAFSPAAAPTAAAMPTPSFSLTPDQIRANPAASQDATSAALLQQQLGM